MSKSKIKSRNRSKIRKNNEKKNGAVELTTTPLKD